MKASSIKPYLRADRNKWMITYRVPGYKTVFNESFETEAEAKLRAAEVSLEKSKGTLRPPIIAKKQAMPTLGEFLETYINDYGTTHWGDSQFSSVHRQVKDYIDPAPISKLKIKDLRTSDFDRFYVNLLLTPAVLRTGHKDIGKTVGISVVEKIHATLRAAMNQAIRWGYIYQNPALNATLPKVEHNKRAVWTREQAQTAIQCCDNTNLKVCLLLAIGCSMRIGEILGLQWENVHISNDSMQNNSSTLNVVQELKRCDRIALEATKLQGNIFFEFPTSKEGKTCKTALVLKRTKTHSSVRTLFIPNTVATAILKLRAEQYELKMKAGNSYNDFGMVIAHPDGRPVEERFISKELKNLIEINGLPKVVFHSSRHLSTSLKLELSSGDIKAVQGDTGHANSSMVTDIYAHTFTENRRKIADKMERSFFSCSKEIANDENKLEEERIRDVLVAHPELKTMLLALANKSD